MVIFRKPDLETAVVFRTIATSCVSLTVLAIPAIAQFADHRELRLRPGQAVVMPAGIVHRTRGEGRTVNPCVEALAAATTFLPGAGTPGT